MNGFNHRCCLKGLEKFHAFRHFSVDRRTDNCFLTTETMAFSIITFPNHLERKLCKHPTPAWPSHRVRFSLSCVLCSTFCRPPCLVAAAVAGTAASTLNRDVASSNPQQAEADAGPLPLPSRLVAPPQQALQTTVDLLQHPLSQCESSFVVRCCFGCLLQPLQSSPQA